MKWLLLTVLLVVGCDNPTQICTAIVPGPPAADATRTMSEDKLVWHWVVPERRTCLSISETWILNGCVWTYSHTTKTRVDCK